MADNFGRFVSCLLSAALFCLPCSVARAEGVCFEPGKPVTLPSSAVKSLRVADEGTWTLLDIYNDSETFEKILSALRSCECVALSPAQSEALNKSPLSDSNFPRIIIAFDNATELSFTVLSGLPEGMPENLVRVNAEGAEAFVASKDLWTLLKSLSVPSIEMEDLYDAKKVTVRLSDGQNGASSDKSLSDLADAIMFCEPVEQYMEVKTIAALDFDLGDKGKVTTYLCSPEKSGESEGSPDAKDRLLMLWYNELFMLDDTDMLSNALQSAGLPKLG